MPSDDLLSFNSKYPIDRILSDFEGNVTTHSVGAATLSGGFYLPETDSLEIANPIGKKAYPTMHYSIDEVNYYPQITKIFQPGNPPKTGRLAASVGMAVNESVIYFYFIHYLGSTVDFTMIWTLDEIV